jgi:hypothetical protein
MLHRTSDNATDISRNTKGPLASIIISMMSENNNNNNNNKLLSLHGD